VELILGYVGREARGRVWATWRIAPALDFVIHNRSHYHLCQHDEDLEFAVRINRIDCVVLTVKVRVLRKHGVSVLVSSGHGLACLLCLPSSECQIELQNRGR
jgi:hypothetical protein